MIVLLLTTSKSPSPALVKRARDALGIGPEVQLSMVSLNRPKRKLLLDEHLVVGASIRPFRGARSVPVAALPTIVKARIAPSVPASPPVKASFIRRAARKAIRVLRRQLGRVGRRRPNWLSLGEATQFLIGTVTSSSVRRKFAAADLVIALDARACRAAWVLAKRAPHPDVVHKVQGGAKVIDRNKTG